MPAEEVAEEPLPQLLDALAVVVVLVGFALEEPLLHVDEESAMVCVCVWSRLDRKRCGLALRCDLRCAGMSIDDGEMGKARWEQ